MAALLRVVVGLVVFVRAYKQTLAEDHPVVILIGAMVVIGGAGITAQRFHNRRLLLYDRADREEVMGLVASTRSHTSSCPRTVLATSQASMLA